MAAPKERFLVDTQGRRTGVVVPMRRYAALMEDLHDLAVVAERREEGTVSLEEMKRRLKRDGLL
ncbi:MAG: hypothetical protein FJ291_05820 [Planctomycetes bacterium]|nr:hypothetical protein [Planctomycetota bacterium]